MNHIRRICRSLSGLPRRAGLLFASAAPAVLWADPPLPLGWNKHPPVPAGIRSVLRFPPGWNKHPPLPAHLHPSATGGTPGWQLALMAVTVILLAATSMATGHRGLGRPAADERNRCRADPQGQPQGERPGPASQLGRDGLAGRFIQDIAAATSVATGQNRPAPPARMPRRRMINAPRLRPRTVQLCAHCHQNPAGFRACRASDQTARQPWCLSCSQGLDPGRYHAIPFDGHGDTGRCR